MKRKAVPLAAGSKSGRAWIGEAFLALFSLALYYNALPGDFVFDDIVLVEGDQKLKEFDLERIFRSNYWGSLRADPNYRPLALLTYALQHRFSPEARTFRAVNLLLNAAAVWIFYRLCRHLFAESWAAFLAALFFAAFPIHTEAVDNIVGRAELLAALAVFGSWWLVQRAPGGEGIWPPVLAALLILLGLLAKENAAAAVGLIPAGIYFIKRKIAWRTALCGGIAILIYLAARELVIHDMLAAIRAGRANIYAMIDNPLAAAALPVRILNAVLLLGLYVWKTLFPLYLSADYSYNQLPVLPLSSPMLHAYVLAVAGFFAAAISLSFRRAPRLALGAVVFLAAVFPVANLAMPIGTIFAERLAYLPSAGLAILLAAAVEKLGGLTATRSPAARLWPLALAGALILAYAARTVARNFDWRDRETMNLRMAEDAPRSARSRIKAAEGRLILSRKVKTPAEREEQRRRSHEEIRAALEIYPPYPHALAFLAELLLEEGRYPEALQALDQALPLYREERLNEPKVHKLRGDILIRQGQLLELQGKDGEARQVNKAALAAFDDFLDTLRKNGAILDPEALSQRGILLAKAGRAQEARADFDLAIRISRDEFPNLYNNRGFLRRSGGDLQGALEDYRRGLEICERKGLWFEPEDQNALLFRMRIFDLFLELGDPRRAQLELEAIRALGPHVPRAILEDLEKRLQQPPR
ncbi:MAG: tetratricopeptide repeat protein [Planctomycetes bacterium]|nr:tetratricopeptide repeat protein [Planctomycetota bacterium]